jgi:hypothetical protein
VTAHTGTTAWKLTGSRTAPHGATCDRCPRTLRNLYDLTDTATGETMTVGRGCLKKVTGWTLTAAQAARLLAQAEREAAALATWGDDFRAARAVAQFPDHDRAQIVGGGLMSYMLDGSPEHMIAPLLAELPALVAELGFAGAPLAELVAVGEEHGRRRLGLSADGR